MRKRVIAIVNNRHKKTSRFLSQLLKTLTALKTPYQIIDTYPPSTADKKKLNTANFFFILGGDGTVLSTMSALNPPNHQKFILAVNFGTLGYMSDVKEKESFTLLQTFIALLQKQKLSFADLEANNGASATTIALLKKTIAKKKSPQIIFDPRTLLECQAEILSEKKQQSLSKVKTLMKKSVLTLPARRANDEKTETDKAIKFARRAGDTGAKSFALNEIAIKPAKRGRPLVIDLQVDGRLLCSFLADGALVSTSTGSTAYNLSAGGPIISPAIDAIIFNAICPHSITMKPLVVSGNEKLTITPHETAYVYSDGKESHFLEPLQALHVQQAKQKPVFIHSKNYNHYEHLKKKLNWG